VLRKSVLTDAFASLRTRSNAGEGLKNLALLDVRTEYLRRRTHVDDDVRIGPYAFAARLGHSYYERLIGTCMRSIERLAMLDF